MRSQTVLLCHGTRIVRESLARDLRALPGVTGVSLASSSAECLARHRAERPTVTVLDAGLRDASGWETTEALTRAAYRSAVVVVDSGDSDRTDTALRHGAFAYLGKEAAVEDVIKAI